MAGPLLEISNLTVDLPPGADREHAVRNLSLSLHPNEILCVVGESGSGKSVMARSILRLLPEPRLHASAGRILFEGRDLLRLPQAEIRQIRGRRISMIFQEPMSALNPLMTIGDQIDEVLKVHLNLPHAERTRRIAAIDRKSTRLNSSHYCASRI